MHAPASPFEAVAERNNWLGELMDKDAFGQQMFKSKMFEGLYKSMDFIGLGLYFFRWDAAPGSGERQKMEKYRNWGNAGSEKNEEAEKCESVTNGESGKSEK